MVDKVSAFSHFRSDTLFAIVVHMPGIKGRPSLKFVQNEVEIARQVLYLNIVIEIATTV